MLYIGRKLGAPFLFEEYPFTRNRGHYDLIYGKDENGGDLIVNQAFIPQLDGYYSAPGSSSIDEQFNAKSGMSIGRPTPDQTLHDRQTAGCDDQVLFHRFLSNSLFATHPYMPDNLSEHPPTVIASDDLQSPEVRYSEK